MYVAIAAYEGRQVKPLSAAQISEKANIAECPLACATVSQFFACLGGFAADLVCALTAIGGVYLTGGIIPKLLPLLVVSEFRTRFDSQLQHSPLGEQSIATQVITAQWPGLIGAAGYLKQKTAFRYADADVTV